MINKESRKEIKDFWEQGAPMSFIGENFTYEEKREFRYALQDYVDHVDHVYHP